VLDMIGSPPALTIDRVIASADTDLSAFLRERKNRRLASKRMTEAGYEVARNPDAADGLWKVGGARKTVFAKSTLTTQERIKAAQQVANGALWQGTDGVWQWVRPA
jgi:hypothetical protein